MAINFLSKEPDSNILELLEANLDNDNILTVRQQDRVTSPIIGYFAQQLTVGGNLVQTILTQSTAINSPVINVASVANLQVGSYIGIFPSTKIGGDRFTFAFIKAINGNTLTLDRPMDYAFLAGDFVFPVSIEMNVNGSISSPQVFVIQAGIAGTAVKFKITNIILQIITSASPEFSDFGDITNGLANGCTLRISNASGTVVENIFNIKTNAEMDNFFRRVTFFDPTFPQAVNGVTCEIIFDGKDNFNTPIILQPGERIEFFILDDLSSLLSVRMSAKGRIFEE